MVYVVELTCTLPLIFAWNVGTRGVLSGSSLLLTGSSLATTMVSTCARASLECVWTFYLLVRFPSRE